MISKLRECDAQTLTAQGPKYDLEKVLEAGRGILKMLVGRSAMRFPDAPPGEIELEPGASGAIDDQGLELLSRLYLETRRDAYDAADLSVHLSFGPYLATWSPLGISALYGPLGNCVTIFEEPWEDLDATPTLFIHARDAPFTPMGRAATRFLAETLRSEPHGTTVDFIPDEFDAGTVAVRFPHAVFGAGEGRIRICRYLDDDSGIGFGGEDDP